MIINIGINIEINTQKSYIYKLYNVISIDQCNFRNIVVNIKILGTQDDIIGNEKNTLNGGGGMIQSKVELEMIIWMVEGKILLVI